MVLGNEKMGMHTGRTFETETARSSHQTGYVDEIYECLESNELTN